MSHPARRLPIVLVVEDEPVPRMMAVDLVGEAGFEAVEATGATEAVAVPERRAEVRVVFSDIDRPRGLDGMRLATPIRRRWPPSKLVLAFDGPAPWPDRRPARGASFPRPCRTREVIATMRRMAL